MDKSLGKQLGFASIAAALIALGAAFLVTGGIAIRQKVVHPGLKKDAGSIKPRYERLIVTKPSLGDVLGKKIVLEGTAWGWFEANVPVRVTDANGVVLYNGAFTLKSDNYERPAYFYEEIGLTALPTTSTGILEFIDYSMKDGSVVYKKDVGLKFNSVPEEAQRLIKLFYYNSLADKNKDLNESYVLPVERRAPVSNTPIQDTINLLLKGDLSLEERNLGFETEFPLDGFGLEGANLKEGVLTLEFRDVFGKTVGGSSRVDLLWAQIKKTAEQFPEVREVKFSPELLFQP